MNSISSFHFIPDKHPEMTQSNSSKCTDRPLALQFFEGSDMKKNYLQDPVIRS